MRESDIFWSASNWPGFRHATSFAEDDGLRGNMLNVTLAEHSRETRSPAVKPSLQ
jgi:hypothetical protein